MESTSIGVEKRGKREGKEMRGEKGKERERESGTEEKRRISALPPGNNPLAMILGMFLKLVPCHTHIGTLIDYY